MCLLRGGASFWVAGRPRLAGTSEEPYQEVIQLSYSLESAIPDHKSDVCD